MVSFTLVPKGLGLGTGKDVGAEALKLLAGATVQQLIVLPGNVGKFYHKTNIIDIFLKFVGLIVLNYATAHRFLRFHRQKSHRTR